MAYNPIVLLRASWKEARNIDERDYRDIESITEPNEPCSLHRGINIKTPSEHLRLVPHETDGLAFDQSKAHNDIASVGGHNLEELTSVTHCLDHQLHIVGLVGVTRDYVVKQQL